MYPITVDDTVLYGKRNVYADKDVELNLLDGSELNIWGTTYINGVEFDGNQVVTNGGGVAAIQVLTQEQYEELSPPAPDVLYVIVEEEDLPVGGIETVVSMTQAEYDELSTPDPLTLYVIVA